MIAKKMSFGFILFGVFYATIACGDTYRCRNSKGQTEFRNTLCPEGSTTEKAKIITPAAQASNKPLQSEAAPTDMWGELPAGYIANTSPNWENRAKISPKIYGPGGPEDVAAPAPKIPSAPASKRSDGALCPMSLASQPQPSGRSEYVALVLDELEARLYTDARSGRISWVQLVDSFYARCADLYLGYRNENNRELPAYQRVLAEQMDARSITESQWVYLLEKKITEIEALDHEIRTRNQLIENTRPSPIIIQNSPPIHRSTNCTTTEFMGRYQTHCD